MSDTDADDHVSEYTTSTRVVEERPPGPHIEVVSWPAEECPGVADSAAALDVYIRQSQNEQGTWPVYEEHGAFASTGEAVARAVELASELATPILDEIRRIEQLSLATGCGG